MESNKRFTVKFIDGFEGWEVLEIELTTVPTIETIFEVCENVKHDYSCCLGNCSSLTLKLKCVGHCFYYGLASIRHKNRLTAEEFEYNVEKIIRGDAESFDLRYENSNICENCIDEFESEGSFSSVDYSFEFDSGCNIEIDSVFYLSGPTNGKIKCICENCFKVMQPKYKDSGISKNTHFMMHTQ